MLPTWADSWNFLLMMFDGLPSKKHGCFQARITSVTMHHVLDGLWYKRCVGHFPRGWHGHMIQGHQKMTLITVNLFTHRKNLEWTNLLLTSKGILRDRGDRSARCDRQNEEIDICPLICRARSPMICMRLVTLFRNYVWKGLQADLLTSDLHRPVK